MRKRKSFSTLLTVLLSLQFFLPATPVYATASPQVAQFLFERGVSLFSQQQFTKAMAEFQKALLANPNLEKARAYVALIERQRAGSASLVEGRVGAEPSRVLTWREPAPEAERAPSRKRTQRPRRKLIWRLEKKMREVVDAVVAEKQLTQEGLPAAFASQMPLGVATALGLPVVPPKEFAVDLRELDKTEPVREMEVAVQDIVIIRAQRIERYLTTDPGYLDVTRTGPDAVRVVPREMGKTVFYVWSEEGRTGFRFRIGPQRWQEAWARQIEERQREARLPESFKLSYSIQSDSFYTGRRVGDGERQSHNYLYTSSAVGQTPFGRFDAAVQASRTRNKEYYIPNIRMGLSDAHYGTLKDIDIRWFDFSSGFAAFGFPSTTLRGVRLDAPMFDRRLRYTAFWGAIPAGDYSQLSTQSGLAKTKEAWLEGIGLSYDLGRLANARAFFAHSYGSERTQPVVTSDTWGVGLQGKGHGIWNWGAEVASDTRNLSYTARTSLNLPKFNVSLSMMELNESYASVFGGESVGGSTSGSLSIVYRPVPQLSISEAFSGSLDRAFFNPDDPDRPNYNSYTRVTWTPDMHTDVELGYVYDDRMGSNAPAKTETKEVTFRKRLFAFRRLSTYLSFQNSKTKNYTSPAQDFNNNRILMGVSFRLLSDLYCYYRKEFNLLRNKFSGERAEPQAQEVGVNYYRQIGTTPFYGRARLYYRDEEDTGSTLSYLSGEDRLEGEGEVTYKPNPDSETFLRLRVANVWAEKAGVAKHVDLDLSWGMRIVWDTGCRWFTRGAFNGLVYKDVNADGVKQRSEEGVQDVRVRCGGREALTNAHGYYYIPDIVGPSARVEIDSGTLPSGYSPTSDPKREEEVVHMATRRVDFGIATRTEVSGIVFVDRNLSGTYDGGDEPMEGVVLILDGKFKTVSGRLGDYMFRNLSPGEHTVTLNLRTVPVAYIPKVPVKKVVTVVEGAAFAYHIPLQPQEKK